MSLHEYEPIPSVVRNVHEQIASTKTLIFHRRYQLQVVKSYCNRMQVGNQRVIQSTLKKHIEKIKKRVELYE